MVGEDRCHWIASFICGLTLLSLAACEGAPKKTEPKGGITSTGVNEEKPVVEQIGDSLLEKGILIQEAWKSGKREYWIFNRSPESITISLTGQTVDGGASAVVLAPEAKAFEVLSATGGFLGTIAPGDKHEQADTHIVATSEGLDGVKAMGMDVVVTHEAFAVSPGQEFPIQVWVLGRPAGKTLCFSKKEMSLPLGSGAIPSVSIVKAQSGVFSVSEEGDHWKVDLAQGAEGGHGKMDLMAKASSSDVALIAGKVVKANDCVSDVVGTKDLLRAVPVSLNAAK